jgi:hypothetical protein
MYNSSGWPQFVRSISVYQTGELGMLMGCGCCCLLVARLIGLGFAALYLWPVCCLFVCC